MRIIIGLAVGGILLTVWGLIDVVKEAFGSYDNFANMNISDFREGDIVHGTITETLGCAATIETTEYAMSVIETDKYTSSYYYIVPFYNNSDDAFPDKVLVYKTGNKEQATRLERLMYETFYWYIGDYNSTTTHVTVDNAEVVKMDNQELEASKEYIEDFLDAYYEGMSKQELDNMKQRYVSVLVPYMVQYRASGASGTILLIGLVMLGILVVLALVYIAKQHKASEQGVTTYVGAANLTNDPNLNSPTGLMNANTDPYFNGGPRIPTPPPAPKTNQPGAFRTDYSRSERPMPPIGNTTGSSASQSKSLRVITGFDPMTGQPVYKTSLADTVFGGQTPGKYSAQNNVQNSAQPGVRPAVQQNPYQSPVQPVRSMPAAPLGDSMPSIDPKTTDQVDLSNGGIEKDSSWEHRPNSAEMPRNGDIPVINPDSYSAAAMFGTIIPAAPSEKLAEKSAEIQAAKPEETVDSVTPIHPPTKADNISSDFQVEQTDPELRNIYSHMSGGDMNEVDPYTEKNVDLSNGGVELPEDDSDFRRSFPSAQPIQEAPAAFTAPEPAPYTAPAAFTVPEPVSYAAPEPAPFPTAPETPAMPEIRSDFPQTEPLKKEEDSGYNIFKTGNSYTQYTSSYSGGSSYNIFKTDDKPTDTSGSDSTGDNIPDSMGFPVENKEFPKVDASFPTAGESDVGGKDDFIF